MADKNVKVTLTASVNGYVSEMGRAADATRKVSEEGRTAGQRLAAGLGGAAAVAAKAGAAALATAALAATGLAAGALRAGVAYNTLQASSRAALSTLLGGAQAANAQMDKLDQFARESPFAKQVFIQAQQQLLGFGVAAQKVIPTLDAVQNAVAAVGGSNNDIKNVVDALAKMQSQGKLTGETLNQLGMYGIDAAGLIGKEMGKTGAEIRDMASKPGGLPVDQVWDPLVKAMQDRFGGAAANVKQTWVGATDRIKGAWRDVGAALAEPFVAKQGGGMAIEWANKFADLLRAIERQVKPLMDAVMTGLTGAFSRVSPMLEAARDAVDRIDMSKLTAQIRELTSYTPLIAGAGAALVAFGSGSIPVLGRFLPAINPVVAGLMALAALSPEIRAAAGHLMSAFSGMTGPGLALGRALADLLVPAITLVAVVMESAVPLVSAFGTMLSGLMFAVTPIVNVLAGFVSALSSLPSPVLTAALAFAALKLSIGSMNFAPVMAGMATVGSTMRSLGEAAAYAGMAYQRAALATGSSLAGMNAAFRTFTGTAGVASAAMGGLRTAIGGLVAAMGGPWGIALMGAAAALGGYSQAQANAQQAAREFARTLDDVTGAFTRQTTQLAVSNFFKDFAEADYSRMQSSLREAGVAVEDLILAYSRGGSAVDEFKAKFDAWQASQRNSGVGMNDTNRLLNTLGNSYAALGRDMDGARVSAEMQSGVLGRLAGDQRAAADAAREHDRVQRELADAMLGVANAAANQAQADIRQAESSSRLAEAVTQVAEAHRTGVAVIDQSTGSLNLHTAAGIAGAQALLAYRESTMSQIDAMLTNGQTIDAVRAKMEQSRSEFIAAAESMGINSAAARQMATDYGFTAGRVQELNNKIGETPAEKKFRLIAETGEAISAMDAAKARWDAFTSKTITLTVGTIYSPGLGQVNAGQFASGGEIRGPGTSTSDSIPAWLSDGEYVVRARAVEKYGVGFLHAVNAMKFASGGAASRGASTSAGAGTDPQAFGSAVRDALTGARLVLAGADVFTDSISARLELAAARGV